MRDRNQKEEMLKYSVSKRWFPQLELDVTGNLDIEKKARAVTDIDVFAAAPDEFFGYRKILMDCKSGAKESPISRALWIHGLMSRMNAHQGICILSKESVELEHRYSASRLDVSILSEKEISDFARATGGSITGPHESSAVANIDIWETYFKISQKFPKLKRAISFSKSKYWMFESEAEAVRKTIIELREIQPELDPEKVEHVAIVGDLASLFLHSVAQIANRVFSAYLMPGKKDELSQALLFILYGGRDSYEHLNSLKRLIQTRQGARPGETPDLKLPEWDRFIEFVRQSLDAPYSISRAPLFAREISWQGLGTRPDHSFAANLASEDGQAARLAMLGAEYFIKATRLPPEFLAAIVEPMIKVQ